MILHTAHVIHSEGLGGKVLGVRITADQSKALCQEFYNNVRGEGNEQHLEWITYEDRGARGWQAQGSEPEDTYYVEENELEIQSRQDDPNGMDWKDRLILQKTVENGRLADQVLEQHAMYAPLEERVEQLSMYIDEVLRAAGYTKYTFKNVDGADEIWEVRIQ